MGSRFSGKESACSEGDLGLIAGWGRFSREGNGYPLQLFLPEESHGQRSLAGYSLWGHKELDTPEHAHTHSLYMTQLKTGNVPTLKNITVS